MTNIIPASVVTPHDSTISTGRNKVDQSTLHDLTKSPAQIKTGLVEEISQNMSDLTARQACREAYKAPVKAFSLVFDGIGYCATKGAETVFFLRSHTNTCLLCRRKSNA